MSFVTEWIKLIGQGTSVVYKLSEYTSPALVSKNKFSLLPFCVSPGLNDWHENNLYFKVCRLIRCLSCKWSPVSLDVQSKHQNLAGPHWIDFSAVWVMHDSCELKEPTSYVTWECWHRQSRGNHRGHANCWVKKKNTPTYLHDGFDRPCRSK